MTSTITILHTNGCGGAPLAIEAGTAVAAQHDDVVVETVLIEESADAIERGFRGSPTVLVNGSDVEPDSQTPVGSMG
ncbi:MAG: hypothetical protein CVT67_08085 [Actinobacteria bacterium HGW-Actinobacteria-7]|nr:MAG: hypothetical protein CVT67_08085 [Actinobacteria bacterium HGW-Actinobacteria-7]